LDLEVLQVLQRYTGNTASTARAHEVFRDYSDMRLTRYPHEALLDRVWALRHNFTAYDAVYIALAEALEAPLITCDAALSSGHRAKVMAV
jgi:predicted nucleic acid-binding protein